ncbi:hypothetical protein [Lentzea sp. NBRC 102530]|uniref:hypothetical protein n=1 Tax=Lentzea sp. NBRC 102530 TaxID=3032201 RepID=UPI0024A40367|nr:hypothetical protein [Lentzea sp. NBRC 102530]GLY53054.1 hypothetical protein Lesp01_67100 [Lentzea sp. NBRC 102530]
MSARLAAASGFAVVALLLALTVTTLVTAALPANWAGVELAAFFFIALGAVLAGPLIRTGAAGSWRAAANGMILAGVFGLVLWVTLVATIFLFLGD